MRMRNLLVTLAIVATLGTTTLAESGPEPVAQTETFRATVQSIGAVGGQTSVLI